MLGGASLIVLPVLALLPADTVRPSLVTAVFWLSLVINYPHFTVSYRLFYEGFGAKVSGREADPDRLRLRYLVAGIGVPVVLVAAMAGAIARGDGALLGYGYSAMIFFVGWHYVKQGYGIAMVDAAMKRRFFDDIEKRVLLANGYVVWFTAWAVRHQVSEHSEFLGVPIRFWDFPDPIIWLGGVATLVTTAATVFVLGRRLLSGRSTAWAGVVGYLAALYAWRLFVRLDPLVVLVVPALHSLQYLHVVRRFHVNRHKAGAARQTWSGQYWRSVALGVLLFLAVPMVLDGTVPFDQAALGALPFSFLFMVGINVHHYFVDSVIWRRSNREVSEHLFG